MKTLEEFHQQIKTAGSGFSAGRHQILQTDVMMEVLVEIRDLLARIAYGPNPDPDE